MDIIEFLKEESDKFQKGWKQVSDRRKDWDSFEDKAVITFESICKEARTQNIFENLYVDNSKKHSNDQKKPPSFVTLFWGRHPTGQTDFRENSNNKSVVEGGCALHYSQLPSGEVAVVFYPFKSELSEPNKRYYIYKLFSTPSKITDVDLQNHTKLMFSYAHCSSFMGKATFVDWCRMKWLQIRSRLREIWHADWIEFLFKRVEKILENQIEDLAKIDSNSSNKAN